MNFHWSRLRLLVTVVCLVLPSFVVAEEEVEVLAEVAKLLALDGEADSDFGRSVSLDGDRLAVGAYSNENGPSSGSVYLFEHDVEGSWIQAAKLVALDGQAFDLFGSSVSLDGDRLAVGAYGVDENGDRAGAAFLFERQPRGGWIQVAKLLALDGEADDFFGVSVSLDGDRVALGAQSDDDNGEDSGSAYLFERDTEGGWLQVSKVLAPDGASGDRFGVSISLDGDRLAVGAYQDDGEDSDSGSAYLFERDDSGNWNPSSKVLALDRQASAYFGLSVSLDRDRLAVGAYGHNLQTGSAYVFERETEERWIQVGKLLALDGQEEDDFGYSVSLDGDRIAVGASSRNDIRSYTGSAYVFERDARGSWIQVRKILPLDVKSRDFFGVDLALDGDRVAIGAPGDDDNGFSSGSSYVFEPVIVSPHLMISGNCPGVIELTGTGMTPRSRFDTYGADNRGSWQFESGPCKGALLDLDSPIPLRQTNSDFDAEGSLIRTVAESWCGTYLQVIDLRTCLTSQVVQIPSVAGPAP